MKLKQVLFQEKNIKKLKLFEFEDFLRVSEKIDEYLSVLSDEIIDLIPDIQELQGINFLLYELLINIYKHSKFTKSFVEVINYSDDNIIDIGIIDNGIGIPNSFKNELNYNNNDCEAIYESINGKTSDKEKYNLHGRGLNTSARITTLGFDGEMLIASNYGVCEITKEGAKLQKCENYINGTFIILRIHNKKIDNLYDCIKFQKINKIEA